MCRNLFKCFKRGDLEDFEVCVVFLNPGLKSIPWLDKDFRTFVWEKERPDGLERCDGYG